MKCTKCGSENVIVNVVNETQYNKGHGCLFTILFGAIYWFCLVIKWMIKAIVGILYWMFWSWISYIICRVQKKDWKKPNWYVKFMRVHGKMYNDQKSVAVCQECGYRKDIVQPR